MGTEASHSGLVRTLGKRVWSNPPRVRISPPPPMISFEDFKKLDIRIGKVSSAERIPDSDKLVKMQVDFGTEQRQILAGIAEYVADLSSLVGKEMPFVVNLEPRKMRGFESQGMMLAAISGDAPILLHPAKEVPPGSKIH